MSVNPGRAGSSEALITNRVLSVVSRDNAASVPTIVTMYSNYNKCTNNNVTTRAILRFLSFRSPTALTSIGCLARILSGYRRVIVRGGRRVPRFTTVYAAVTNYIFYSSDVIIFRSKSDHICHRSE